MTIDFSSLNFETLDANMNANPDIFVNQNGVTFSKRAVEELSYPAYVICKLDAKNKVFAVRSCRCDERRALRFSKSKGEQKTTVSILNRNIVEPIRQAMEGIWMPGKRYKVSGFWVADEKTMCYDLSEGVQEDYRIQTAESEGNE